MADTAALKSYAEQQANAYGVPPQLFTNLISTESGWNPYAVGAAGEQGIAQLMPGTAPGINRFDPFQSLAFSAQLLRSYFDRFGSWDMAVAAYNAGPRGNFSNPQTQSYVQKILGGGTSSGTGATAVNTGALKILFWAAVVIVGIIVIAGVSQHA